MTASGTYTYAPSVADIGLQAYARIGRRRASLTQEHFADLVQEANLLQMEWSNRGVNLWTVDEQTQTLTSGTSNYSIPATTITILDAFIRTGTSPNATDIYLTPISRTEWATINNKATSGRPNQYWFDRLISPVIYLWPVPDDSTTYELHYYRYRQIQDATLPSGVTPEVPQRWLDATVAGLAARLAAIHAPELEDKRKGDAERAFQFAAAQDTENVPLYLIPQIGGYYPSGSF